MVGWGIDFPQFCKEVPCKIIIGQLIQKGIKIHKISLNLKLHRQALERANTKQCCAGHISNWTCTLDTQLG
jgi:hypothetical protein